MPTFQNHPVLASSNVATAPSPATSGTSVAVATGDGAKFGTAPFQVAIWPAGAEQTLSNCELATCTARSTDTLTITRAQEGTTARTVVVGDQIAAVITPKHFTDIESALSGGGSSQRLLRVVWPYAANSSWVSSTSGNYATSASTNGNFQVRTNSDNGTNRQSYGATATNTYDPGTPYSSLSGNWTFQMRLGCATSHTTTVTGGVFRYRVIAVSRTDTDYLSDTVKHITIKHLCAGNGASFSQDALYIVVGDGTSASSTLLSGVSICENFVNIRLEMTGGTSLKVYVDDSLKTTITTGLPNFSGTSLYFGGGSIEESATTGFLTYQWNYPLTELELA